LSPASVPTSHEGVATQGGSASLTFYAADIGDGGTDDSLEWAFFLGFLLPLRSKILRRSYEPQPLGIDHEAALERPG
jgi:hypothetical protein